MNPPQILVVDDEIDLQLLIRQRFRSQIRDGKYQFFFALNGKEALELLEKNREIEVVLTDINMPVMDGLALLDRISKLAADVHANAPGRLLETVIVSAYDDMRNIRVAMNRGAYDFLTKPIDFNDFESTLDRTLAQLADRRQALLDHDQLSALRHELEVATRIQQSILPSTFPPFPHRPEVDIFASMLPARDVGGDFYDFFFQDPNRLAFVIGDVSGKGIPAAIFMAVSRTLLRATALREDSPVRCLEHVNQILSAQSEGQVFVTIFMGVLDLRTGEMEYSVGGQNPPFLLKHDRGPVLLSEPKGLMVGLFEDATHELGKVQFQPGETIVLYTDGIPEAENVNQEMFTTARLKTVLSDLPELSASGIAEHVMNAVRRYSGNVIQSDDVTILALRYHGPKGGVEFEKAS